MRASPLPPLFLLLLLGRPFFSFFFLFSCSCVVKIPALPCDAMRWVARCDAKQRKGWAAPRKAGPGSGHRHGNAGNKKQKQTVTNKK